MAAASPQIVMGRSAPVPLPHWGRGTASAVDRVLSLIADLRRISSLFFIRLEPYPARSARHLPLEGKALFARIVFPHMRVFTLTMREKRCSRIVAFPLGEGYGYTRNVIKTRTAPIF